MVWIQQTSHQLSNSFSTGYVGLLTSFQYICSSQFCTEVHYKCTARKLMHWMPSNFKKTLKETLPHANKCNGSNIQSCDFGLQPPTTTLSIKYLDPVNRHNVAGNVYKINFIFSFNTVLIPQCCNLAQGDHQTRWWGPWSNMALLV